MAQAEFDVNDFENRYAADKGVHARFYMHAEQDHEESAAKGRPVFKDTEFVEIIAAGNATNIIRRPARQMDKQRFQRQYEAFKAGHGDSLVGTPLVEVPWITRSQVEELSYLRIRTLEQLANVSDTVCGRQAGLYDLKRKAQGALEASEGAAQVTSLAEENKRLTGEVDLLKEQLTKLIAVVEGKGTKAEIKKAAEKIEGELDKEE